MFSSSRPAALPPAFHAIWAAHTVSQFGSQVTLLALPLTALLVLGANPFQMGLLTALGSLPNLLFSLPAGVWVDRWNKKRTMIGTDLARAALLLPVPLLAHFSLLRLEPLLLIAFLVGAASVFFDLASAATVPVLLGRDHLIGGNARLEASRSTASVTGPSLGGVLVQALGAPLALLLDALSFVASALLLTRIPTGSTSANSAARPRMWAEVRVGLRALLERPLLGALVRSVGLWNFFVGVGSAVHLLFLTRNLGLGPAQVGAVLTAEGVGMLCGTALVGPLQRRFPLGTVLMASGALAVLCAFGVVGVSLLPPPWRFPALLVNDFLSGLGYMVFAILTSSCRQAATPAALQGRVAATFRFVILGGLPLGALLGGVIAQGFSPSAALLTTAAGMLLAWALLFATSIPGLRQLPEA
ncbi:MFS transporter [Deinococcus aetherius]|uniref:MFS transporter n=1 Tax=Deinococcus aetherius TaxID=200252 RepID=A0ABM8AEH2_9DEIO|nr:MFS transporter [Deinococcus aetherius]BDP42186.1 MFS transporter [Deinococcus aetherius]